MGSNLGLHQDFQKNVSEEISVKHKQIIEKIGFDLTFFSSDFSRIICSLIGLNNRTDEFYEWYDNEINSFCKEIDLHGAEFILTNAPVALRMGSLQKLGEQLNAPVIAADATSVEDLENLFKAAQSGDLKYITS